jgi:type IV pilus assembly protein PilA
MLRHRELAQDTSAKSDARQMLTQVEACGTTNQNYTNCTLTDLGATGLPTSASPGKGEVGIAIVDAGHYKVTAVSRSGGNFYIERQSLASAAIRTCDGGTVGCHAANASGNQW